MGSTSAGFNWFSVAVLERTGAFSLVQFAVRPAPRGVCIEVADFAGGARASLPAKTSDLAAAAGEWRDPDRRWCLRFDPVLAAAALHMRLAGAASVTSGVALAYLDAAHRRLAACAPAPARVAFAAPSAPAGAVSSRSLDVAGLFFDEGRKLRSAGASPDAAELLLRAALDTQHAELGDAQRCAVTRNDLGLLMREAGRDADALFFFGDAHAYFVDHHGHDHPDRATTLHNHGATLLRLGRRGEAESELRAALALHVRHRRSAPRDHANTLWLLAEALGDGQEAETRALLESSLDLRDAAGCGSDLDASRIAEQLARACSAAGEPMRPMHFAKRSVDMLHDTVGPADARMQAAVQWAASLFVASGCEPDAQRLRRRFSS